MMMMMMMMMMMVGKSLIMRNSLSSSLSLSLSSTMNNAMMIKMVKNEQCVFFSIGFFSSSSS